VVVAATHAVIFAIVCHLTRRFVVERFQDEGEEEDVVTEVVEEEVEEGFSSNDRKMSSNNRKMRKRGSKAKKPSTTSWFFSWFR
jgi:hypothetical protein